MGRLFRFLIVGRQNQLKYPRGLIVQVFYPYICKGSFNRFPISAFLPIIILTNTTSHEQILFCLPAAFYARPFLNAFLYFKLVIFPAEWYFCFPLRYRCIRQPINFLCRGAWILRVWPLTNRCSFNQFSGRANFNPMFPVTVSRDEQVVTCDSLERRF